MHKSLKVAALGAFLAVFTQGIVADSVVRLSDKDVKSLAKTLTKQEKSVEKALPSKFKRSVLRGPGGELKVGDYFSDLERAIKNLNKRFTGEYSASAEATEVFQRSSLMHGYIQSHPELKGANEWDVYAGSLKQLASAYGTTFPLPDDAVVRRIGDRELSDAAKATADFAKKFDSRLGKSTKKVKTLTDPVKGARADLKTMASVSKTLSSRIRSGKPSTAEARQLMVAVEAVDGVIGLGDMPADVVDAWQAGQGPIDKISKAFMLD
jgi:hypothetical protein